VQPAKLPNRVADIAPINRESELQAGGSVLFADTDGKGNKSRHSPEEQTVIWIAPPRA
jgi:hypothetical protein